MSAVVFMAIKLQKLFGYEMMSSEGIEFMGSAKTSNSPVTFHGPDTTLGDMKMAVRGGKKMYSNMQRGQKVVL
jgi:hypothetical protein